MGPGRSHPGGMKLVGAGRRRRVRLVLRARPHIVKFGLTFPTTTSEPTGPASRNDPNTAPAGWYANSEAFGHAVNLEPAA
jgi:hypothetical protein